MKTEASVGATFRASSMARRNAGAVPRSVTLSESTCAGRACLLFARLARDQQRMHRAPYQHLEVRGGEGLRQVVERTLPQRSTLDSTLGLPVITITIVS